MSNYRPTTDEQGAIRCDCDVCYIDNIINADAQVKAMRQLLSVTKDKQMRLEVKHFIRARKAELRARS